MTTSDMLKQAIRNLTSMVSATAIAAVALASCGSEQNLKVAIETPYGTMKAVLYDDTPLHRDNFIKLVREGAYDSLLFHRVIRGFMIQGGDPESAGAPKDKRLGESSIGDPIPAEIRYPAHFHKRGALAAARASDATNPERKSSGSQFYIVQGTVQTEKVLDETETIHNNKVRVKVYNDIMKFYADSLQDLQNRGKAQELSDMQIRIIEKVEEIAKAKGEFMTYPREIRDIYETQGGTPHLDTEYTVFGEVYEGLNVIDSIASVGVVPPAMRPGKDIWMVIREIKD